MPSKFTSFDVSFGFVSSVGGEIFPPSSAMAPLKESFLCSRAGGKRGPGIQKISWLPDGYSQFFRSYVFGPLGFWTMAPLRCAAKFDPFLSLDCARVEGVGAPSKEREGSNLAV